MKKYRGYYIDGFTFENEKQIDAFIKKQAVESFKRACSLFEKYLNLEASRECTKRAEFLVNQCGCTWAEIEKLEIEALGA